MMIGIEGLLAELESEGHAGWAETLRQRAREFEHDAAHGLWPQWTQAICDLPAVEAVTADFGLPAVTLSGEISPEDQQRLREQLRLFHPWRKGPFDLFGIAIDTEWRSDWKWARVAPHLDLRDASVLDVGCGNGYYGWRMLAAGARRVIGLDPFPLYIAQHRVVEHYVGGSAAHVLPGTDADLPKRLEAFDVAFSMGVLYHRTSPIDHLKSMLQALRPGGKLVLETLIIDHPDSQVLIPEGRYAKMRNVWFIPSLTMLERFLSRCGFRDIEVVDVCVTTTEEQRRTEWMEFESLSDFLSPDQTTTIEGHPLPTRATVVASRG
ncbi:tRNA 5-methoxyuridine(34)/uridine 5-oxyacetic acid(34) synthase CmoB [Rosistilla oblonga]|uniref:tRNA 5-methoxyuridine(34)/uridine 5-oxyacetic acid(34) synthase CmoB n=1 Tax=Rosistilla oblonga TaxID=2527990 RepID=UPI003A97EAF4